MKQLTILGVDDRLYQELRNRADQHGMSVNRYVLGASTMLCPDPVYAGS